MRTLYISAFMLLLPFLLHAESFPYDNSPTIPAEEKSAVNPQIAVKTNGLLWLTTVMNGECEVFFRPHISASLSLAWCPWFISKKFALRNLSIMPEARWWLRTDAKGHFFGLHLSASWYNVKFGDFRYQDTNRPLLGGGITYGYYLPLNTYWGVELSIGAGYLSMRYDKYHNVDNGAKIDTRKTSWFGIDRAAISISYRFPH